MVANAGAGRSSELLTECARSNPHRGRAVDYATRIAGRVHVMNRLDRRVAQLCDRIESAFITSHRERRFQGPQGR